METGTLRASFRFRIKLGAGLKRGCVKKLEVRGSRRSKLCNFPKAQDCIQVVGHERAVHKAGKPKGGGESETELHGIHKSLH